MLKLRTDFPLAGVFLPRSPVRLLSLALCCLVTSCGGGSGADKSSKVTRTAAVVCSFPECIDSEAEDYVVSSDLSDALARRKGLNALGLDLLVYRLPRWVKSDEYESKGNFLKRMLGQIGSWKIGELTPTTKLLISRDINEYATAYDADQRVLKVTLPVGRTAMILDYHHSSSDKDYGGIRGVQETDSRDAIWFTNVRPISDPSIDGNCVLKYPAADAETTISLPMNAEVARSVRGKLRVLLLATFDAPATASKSEWCYSGIADRGGDAMLFKGGAMVMSSLDSFVNMRANRLIVTDGEHVLYKTFA